MSDNRERDPEGGGNGNPWIKSLVVWGGIFLALLLVVSMFGALMLTILFYSLFTFLCGLVTNI